MNRTPEVPEEDEEVNPSASALIEALRSFGYSVSTSIADLLDNSVAAGARRIWIDFNWDGTNTHVTVLDDGCGMADAVLEAAMKVGSQNPLEQRSPPALGW
jgi:signal transduction histidine kinase